ncbi:CHAT domain-containing protein [Streptomyces sp. NPDC013455]|uniref:CHAT domain-containing protein n=1 Tax=Streptomyces sp. NPDC013455 TaxID=3155605 RepID=UPI0033E52EB4
MVRDRLITALLDRVARYNELGDKSAVLAEAALNEADRLRRLMSYENGSGQRVLSVAALDALIMLHRARHAAEPIASACADYGIVLRLSLSKAQLFPDLVPDDFAEALAAARKLAAEADMRARRLGQEFERTGGVEHLDQAVYYHRCAVNLATGGGDVPGLTLARLSAVLGLRFRATGRREDLDEAIAVREASIAATADGHPELARRWVQMSGLLAERHELTGNARDLDRAVAEGRRGVAATPPGTAAQPRRMLLLACLLGRHASVTSDRSELEEAVELARKAIESAEFEAAGSLGEVSRLAGELRDWYDREHDLEDLNRSVELPRGLLRAASGTTLARARMLLATALFFRHIRTGDLADLNHTIELERQALPVYKASGDAELHRRGLTNLFVSHRVRYERLGSPEDLDEAVRIGTEAVSGGTGDEVARSELGMAFLQRYQRTFEPADFDRAFHLTTAAVAAFPADVPGADRAAALSRLARVLVTRLQEQFDPAQLATVIDLARDAVKACPRSHTDHVRHLADLANGLLARYGHSETPEDLEEAIHTLESALAVGPVAHPSRRAHLAMLAEALTRRPDPSREDLDRAVALTRQAVSLPGEDTFAARSWLWLGNALRERHTHRGNPSDLRQAVNCWRHVAALPTATVQDRIMSGASWGAAATFLGDVQSAAEGYDHAAVLLPQLAWHGLPQAAREKYLLQWPGLASTAAAAHILAGAPHRAVEVLEQGRTVIQSQLLHTRSDLSRLAERAPELSERLLSVRERMDAQRLTTGADADASRELALAPLSRERLAQERAALCREWDDLLAEARRLEGFEHFLTPVPYAELSTAADGGPVVVVNVSRLASHALVIRAAEPVEVVELPGVTDEGLARQAQTFLNVLLARRRGNQPFLRRERDRHAVHDVLEWLWENLARPVLDRLDFTGRDAERLPRLWWCPTGLAALLPLHAAGRYPRHRTARPDFAQTVPGRVVSSYTATLAALRRARDQPDGGTFRGLLAVGLPETPGQAALPGVEREHRALRSLVPAATQASDLIGPEATREAVRRQLHEHSWAHFACHAEQSLMDPAQSAFLLYDGRLAASELLEMDLPSAELAYLSACETAAGGVNLPDEVLHLASTLQCAGYRHVVATMWSILDGSAPGIAARFYSAVNRSGRPDAGRAARALHDAVAAHRAQDPTDLLRWAAFLHVGP